MQFGQRVSGLRKACSLTQKELAKLLDVSPGYVNKVERERLHFGDYPSEKFIHRLAEELDADEDELLILTDRVPASLRKRIQQRPEAFNQFAALDDKSMDLLLSKSTNRRSPANANRVFCHDPQLAMQLFLGKRRYQLFYYVQHVRSFLALETQHDNSEVVFRWINADVSEVQVERDDRSPFVVAPNRYFSSS